MRGLSMVVGIFVATVVAAIIGVLALYAAEDWEGSRMWADTQNKLQALGEPTSYETMIPGEVPEDLNFGALPVFASEPRLKGETDSPKMKVSEELLNIAPANVDLPKVPPMESGSTYDFDPGQKFLADRYAKVFGKPPGSLKTLEQFDALCPLVNELREASAARPECRFPRDYTSKPAYGRSYSSVTAFIKLTQILDLHAIVALQDKRPDVALGDIETALKIASGVRKEPILVSGLVAIGINALQISPLREGIKEHAWTDSQLAELQQKFEEVDFLADGQLCLRGEAVGALAPLLDAMKERLDVPGIFGVSKIDGLEPTESGPLWANIVYLTPRGWWDLAKTRAVLLQYTAARESIDLHQRIVHAEKSEGFVDQSHSIHKYDIAEILTGVAQGVVISSIQKFAQGQTQADSAAMACALERYHLLHGKYPENLNALASLFPKGMPHDVINGKPYQLQLQPNDTYLFYSVGWNQDDDGGVVIYKPGTKYINYEQGDWVWLGPNAKRPPGPK